MAANDNLVCSVALQFSRSFKEPSPEAVLYGYAKLLLMDESTLINLIPKDKLPEVESARKICSAMGINLSLIKTGLTLLTPYLPKDKESLKKQEDFKKYLAEVTPFTTSEDILKRAIQTVSIPVVDIFAPENDMQAIFAYQDYLKRKPADTPAEPLNKRKGAPSGSIKSEAATTSKDNFDDIRAALGKALDKTAAEKGSEEKPLKTNTEAEKPVATAPKTEYAVSKETSGSIMDLTNKYKVLNAALLDVVKGQDIAVSKFIRGLFRSELVGATEERNAPSSYYFFFGPPGTGKTLLAETAAKHIGIPFYRFDMSDYSSADGAQALTGTSNMYKNSTEGELITFVKRHPKCLILFDEIEKAHPLVLKLFLQILGSGHLNNPSKDEIVDFRDTTIIFTSNVGKELYADRSTNLTALPDSVILSAILDAKNEYDMPALPPELCSRIASGNMIIFNHLSVRTLAKITTDRFNQVIDNIQSVYGWQTTYADQLPLLFIYHQGNKMDARIANSQSGNFLKDEVLELTRQLENNPDAVKNIKRINMDIEWDTIDSELKPLFMDNSKTEILVFGDDKVVSTFSFDTDRYKVHTASTVEKAMELLKQDITAIFVDPLYGESGNNSAILSVADYSSKGVDYFHKIISANTGLPVYILSVNDRLSPIDKNTFVQEGATNVIDLNSDRRESFQRLFTEIMSDHYMEKQNFTFGRQGWVLEYATKQDITTHPGQVDITFYGFKKKLAPTSADKDSLLSEADRPTTTFKDIIGADSAKEELKYFIDYLKNPKKFMSDGVPAPKGVLLYGPPGTGKTMLARAMAGESDVTFLQTNAAEFMNMYVGESEANVRRLFERARSYAPAIVFIDEIDAIGKQRTGQDNDGSEKVLNALLTEMDGFKVDPKRPVFVLAATNFGVRNENKDVAGIDKALIRRFDNTIYVDLPTEEERKKYLVMLVSKVKNSEVSEETLSNIAKRTIGKSPAILKNIFELARRTAIKAHRPLCDKDLFDALENYEFGEKHEDSSPEYYRSTAIHETGHAVISYLSGIKPSYITIESRGNFGGYMMPDMNGIHTYSKDFIIGRIRTSLAGRAAELVFYPESQAINSGASGDLQHATSWALDMIGTYGMTGSLAALPQEVMLKSSLASKYVEEANAILAEQMKETIRMIEENKALVEKIADVLVKKNTLTQEEFLALVKE